MLFPVTCTGQASSEVNAEHLSVTEIQLPAPNSCAAGEGDSPDAPYLRRLCLWRGLEATGLNGADNGNTKFFTKLQPADQQFALVDHLRRQMIVQIDEQLLMPNHLLPPGSRSTAFNWSNVSREKSSPVQSMSS